MGFPHGLRKTNPTNCGHLQSQSFFQPSLQSQSQNPNFSLFFSTSIPIPRWVTLIIPPMLSGQHHELGRVARIVMDPFRQDVHLVQIFCACARNNNRVAQVFGHHELYWSCGIINYLMCHVEAHFCKGEFALPIFVVEVEMERKREELGFWDWRGVWKKGWDQGFLIKGLECLGSSSKTCCLSKTSKFNLLLLKLWSLICYISKTIGFKM